MSLFPRRSGAGGKHIKAIVLGVSLLLSVACALSSATGKGASATGKGASGGADANGGAETTTQALANVDPDNSYICEKVKPTGSNIPEEVCKTVRQRRQEREDA